MVNSYCCTSCRRSVVGEPLSSYFRSYKGKREMSGGQMLPVSQCETEKVAAIQFEIFKAKQIKLVAACCISEPVGYLNDKPVRNGLADLRMGTTDFQFKCETCNMGHPDCPGHFGYCDLAEPVFNIGLYDVTLQALRCVCKSCGALLGGAEDGTAWEEAQQETGLNRLRALNHLVGTRKVCKERNIEGHEKGCGQNQPRLMKPKGLYPRLVIECVENENVTRWYGEEVLRVLDRISDEDARFMGFKPEQCHPRDLIITVLPIPPPQVRPTVSFGTARSDNELTHKLTSILKINHKLAQEKAAGAGREAITDARELLQEHIGTYFNNSSTYYKPSTLNSRLPIKSITERLKGKFGRLRGYLMGKRVDFSARTVITGDPVIDVDEVGVPLSVAQTLTFPERVNHTNKKRLTDLVRNPVYPGANYIIHSNGQMRNLRLLVPTKRKLLTIDVGDVVERHVQDGDVVLFNRQPTLHRMSMMGHRARVLPFNTFRLNLSCTTPYNADFDGDEMNLHVPQSFLTKAELHEMMMVPKNFVSPNKSQPCMGIVQDSLLGCFRLTDKETFLDKYFMQSLVMWVDRWAELPVPAIVKPIALWTGKQVFSLVLPDVTHVVQDSNMFSHEDKPLIIRRGQLLGGMIRKQVVGVAPGSLIHIIFAEKGPDEVTRFINGVQRTTAYFLYNSSFSVGVQDTVVDRATLDEINDVLKATRKKVKGISAMANQGTLQRKTGMTLLQSFEKDVNNALNACREQAARKALSKVRRTNNFKCMIEAGSKGSDLNICQIAVMVGQQNVNGSRIPFHFRRRTLPHFVQDDYGETSRGMVNRGYLDGLKPPEFFFHTMGGREGLIDTAVKTADTGYLQRKLIKAMEDVHAAYDGTVRNANKDVVQFIYGEDGLDGLRIEQNQTVDIMGYGDKEMNDKFRFEFNADGSFSEDLGSNYMSLDVKRMLRAAPREYHDTLQAEYTQLVQDRDDSRKMIDKDKVQMSLPINLLRLIRNAQTAFEVGRPSQTSDLNPGAIISGVQKLERDIRQFFPSHNKAPGGNFRDPYCEKRVDLALRLFGVHLRTTLAAKRVMKEYRLSEKSFEFLLGEIRLKYLQSIIQPGEMVGAIAAQSCGEPATQMTLNTFHNAGISSKNVTLGVPRLLELLNVSKNQRNSSMLITLIDSWSEKQKCGEAVHLVEYASLESITKKFQIVYDPDPRNTVIDDDKSLVESEWSLDLASEEEELEMTFVVTHGSPWVARLEIDADLFVDKHLTMNQIKAKLRKAATLPGATCPFVIEHTLSVSAPNQVIRLRLRNPAELQDVNDVVAYLKVEIPKLLSEVHLAGIKGVKKVLTAEKSRFVLDAETNSLKSKKHWCLDTEGTALREVFGRVTDEKGNAIIDPSRTASNKIPEIYNVLGIEAARRKLFFEMREAYEAYGVNINYRHYSILIDTMCQRGSLMAVSRVGINRSEAGPLMRCSFEETVKVLMGAAAFGQFDPCVGVSANILLGSQAKVGTGLFDLVLNTATLRDAVTQELAVRSNTDQNVYHGLSSVLVESAIPADLFARTPVAQGQSQRYDGATSFRPLGAVTHSPVHASAMPSAAASAEYPRHVMPVSMLGKVYREPRSSAYSAPSVVSMYEPASGEFGKSTEHQVVSGVFADLDSERSVEFPLESKLRRPGRPGRDASNISLTRISIPERDTGDATRMTDAAFSSMHSSLFPASAEYEAQTPEPSPEENTGASALASHDFSPSAQYSARSGASRSGRGRGRR